MTAGPERPRVYARGLIVLALSLSGPASASSATAWATEAQQASRACVAASGLGFAHVTGRPAVFDDRLHLDALLVSGRPRQRWLHGRLVTMLCLYDRRTHRAQAVEAPGWPRTLR